MNSRMKICKTKIVENMWKKNQKSGLKFFSMSKLEDTVSLGEKMLARNAKPSMFNIYVMYHISLNVNDIGYTLEKSEMSAVPHVLLKIS